MTVMVSGIARIQFRRLIQRLQQESVPNALLSLAYILRVYLRYE